MVCSLYVEGQWIPMDFFEFMTEVTSEPQEGVGAEVIHFGRMNFVRRLRTLGTRRSQASVG